jgi:hypothetical protein
MASGPVEVVPDRPGRCPSSRRHAPSDDEDGGVAGRWRAKRPARHAGPGRDRKGRRPPGPPRSVRSAPPAHHVAGHDEIGCHEAAAPGGEAPEERLGHPEGWIGQHPERPAGESQVGGIDLDHDDAGSAETLPQSAGTARVALDGDHPRTALQQRDDQRAGSRADVEHELARPDARVADDSAGPRPIELMPSPPGPGFPGHGGPSRACPRTAGYAARPTPHGVRRTAHPHGPPRTA